MERTEIVLMVSTFVIGCLLGGYVYINGMWAVSQDVTPQTVEWRITGEEEGDCQFRGDCQFVYVDAAGVYRLASADSTAAPEEGQLPRSARADLATLLSATDVDDFQTGYSCDVGGELPQWYRYTVEQGRSVRSYVTCDPVVAAAPLNDYLALLWTEAGERAAGPGSTGDYAYEIFHDADDTWLSNFRLIDFRGTE